MNPNTLIIILLLLVLLTSRQQEGYTNSTKCHLYNRPNFRQSSRQNHSNNRIRDSEPSCYPNIDTTLSNLHIGNNSQLQAQIDATLLEDYPLINGDAEHIKRSEYVSRMMDGGLYNISKKVPSNSITPYDCSSVGQYMSRNKNSNTSNLALF